MDVRNIIHLNTQFLQDGYFQQFCQKMEFLDRTEQFPQSTVNTQRLVLKVCVFHPPVGSIFLHFE